MKNSVLYAKPNLIDLWLNDINTEIPVLYLMSNFSIKNHIHMEIFYRVMEMKC